MGKKTGQGKVWLGLQQRRKMQQAGQKGLSVSNKSPFLTSQASLCLIQSIYTYLLCAFYVPSTVLRSGDTEMGKNKHLALKETTFWGVWEGGKWREQLPIVSKLISKIKSDSSEC